MKFINFDISLEPKSSEGYPVLARSAKMGEERAVCKLDVSSPEMTTRLETIAKEKMDGDGLMAFGRLLASQVLTGLVNELFQRTVGAVQSQHGSGVRIRLHINAPELNILPWECLRTETDKDPLGISTRTVLTRYTDMGELVREVEAPQPLQMLGVIPQGSGLNIEKEKTALDRAVKELGDSLKLTWLLGKVTLDLIREKLGEAEYHVVHFIGHGYMDSTRAGLRLNDEYGDEKLISAETFSGLFRDSSVRLVVLNACRGATRSSADALSGVAAQVVQRGVPAVVAMQWDINDRVAQQFARSFYWSLCVGPEAGEVDTAVTKGRAVLYDDWPGDRAFATPVLFLRAEDGRLWKSDGEAVEESRGELKIAPAYFQAAPAQLRHSFDVLLADKLRGFVGRQFVFDAIDGFIKSQSSGYFIIRGAPGMGKSALMAKLINDRGYIHHFNIATQNIRSPRLFLENVCAQVIARYALPYKELPSGAMNDSGFFLQCLGEAAAKRETHPIVVAVDSLDESDRLGLAPAVNALYLPPSLPDGVYIVVTTRPLADLRLQVMRQKTLDLEADSEGNLQDIETYIAARTAHARLRDWLVKWNVSAEQFVAAMTKKSQGNFMYLYHVLPAIEQGKFVKGTLSELPDGLMAYYQRHWRQMRDGNESDFDTICEPIVCILGVTQEPVTTAQIAAWTKLRPGQVNEYIQRWYEFLDTDVIDGKLCFRVYHASFQDFLKEQVDLVRYDDMIADYYLGLSRKEA